jgi:hypothetical protein
MFYLVVVATVEVHGIEAKKAWTIFGVLFFLLIVVSMGSQYSARQMANNMNAYRNTMMEEGAHAAKGEPVKEMSQEKPGE